MDDIERYANDISAYSMNNMDMLKEDISPDERKRIIASLEKYALQNGFSRQNLIELIKKNPKHFYIDALKGAVPEIEIGKDDQRILNEIEAMGPFATPEQLAQAIAKEIKKYMKYDFFTYLLSPDKVDKNTLEACYISVASYENFKRHLDWIISTTTDSQFKKIVLELRAMAQSIDKNQFKKMILNNIDKKDFPLFWKNLGKRFSDLAQYSNEKTVGNYFRLGVGDCKHFAAMMYVLYRNLGPKYFPNSKMLQVFVPFHTYNLLISQNPYSSKISEKYLDMTSYLSGGALFIPKSNESKFIISKNNSQDEKEKGLS